MTPLYIALGTLALLALIGLVYFLTKASQSHLQGGFRLLQESFEGMQRNLMLSHKEFEKSYEMKTGALRSEIQEALQTNRKELSQGLLQTTQNLEGRLQNLTQNVGNKLEQNLKEGFVHFEKIQEHLKQAEKQLLHLNSVGESINDLNDLLKLPHLRGSFGEAMLEQILNDLLPRDCYELQYQIVPGSTERVDAVIKYPTHVLPIDSKFPREQVLPLFETNDPVILETARKTLSDAMKTLARQIKEKYIHPEHGTTEMALLFVPSETLYFEMLKNIRLCEDLAKYKVFAVSPNTLAVSLHAISVSRNYYEMAKGVEKTIAEIKKAQQHYRNFEGRFDEVGKSLNKAQSAFNMATTHMSRYSSAVTRLTGAEAAELSPGAEALPVANPDPISI